MTQLTVNDIFTEDELIDGHYSLFYDIKSGFHPTIKCISCEQITTYGWWQYSLLVFQHNNRVYAITYKDHASPISADDDYMLETLVCLTPDLKPKHA